MGYSPWFWFFLNLLSILVLSFYSMLEMACVTFNKVRLQYYVSKGIKQAIWLNYLLQNPSRLFGTTLIGVNVALFVGSECAREFYSSLGLDPDIAPLTQVIIVVIFGELAPMFAARRYAEHVAMLGVPIIYFSAKVMTPLLWLLGTISKICNKLIGGSEENANIFLTQAELQKILEEQDEDKNFSDDSDFNTIATNIFGMRKKIASEIMEPLNSVQSVNTTFTVGQVRSLLTKTKANYILVHHREATHIVGIALPRDLLRIQDNRKVRDYVRPPWFVTQQTNVTQILNQFRNNNQTVAIILNKDGKAIGLINLDDIMQEIVGKTQLSSNRRLGKLKNQLLIDRTFPGDMTVGEFNKQFEVVLDKESELTLGELMEEKLGHHPSVGEGIILGHFELEAKESSLLEVKRVSVTSRL